MTTALTPGPTDPVGRRLRELRATRGLSLRALAELAGMSHGYLSKIERGERPVERRSTVEALAAALRVAPSELTGQPLPPVNQNESIGHAAVDALHGVLRDIEVGMLDDQTVPALGLAELRAELDRATRLQATCDFAALGETIPGLVARSHQLAAASREGRLLHVVALVDAFYLAKDLGYHDAAWEVTRHLYDAATELGDPAWVGIAQFLRAEAMLGTNSRSRALALTVKAADALAPDSAAGGEAWGMLRLSTALQSAVTGAHHDVPALLDEAADMAARTGDRNFAGMHFGPRNVSVWRVGLAVEVGDVERVPDLARNVDVGAIPSQGRQATFFMDLSRGLAARRGKEPAAVDALRRAETLAPQLVHANPYARETVTGLLARARRDAGGRELRGLAYRLGVGG